MKPGTKHDTTITLDADTLAAARELGLDVSAVAEEAILKAVEEVRRKQWLAENTDVFSAQSDWHEQNGHPLADILSSPSRSSWER